MLRPEFDALSSIDFADLRREWGTREAAHDRRIGTLAAVFVNLRKPAGSIPTTAEDVFPYLSTPKPPQTEEEMLAVIRAIPGLIDKTKG